MIITLNQQEIIEAIKVKVSSLLPLDAYNDINVTLKKNTDNYIEAIIGVPTRDNTSEVGISTRSDTTDTSGESGEDDPGVGQPITGGDDEEETEPFKKEDKQEINKITSLFGSYVNNTL